MASETPLVAAVAVKLPSFWAEEPEIWFSQAESQFSLRSITEDETNYHHVIAALDQTTAKRIKDLIQNPPPKGSKFMGLKTRLVSTFTLSAYQRAQRLTRMSPLGDRLPSQLMDEMLGFLEDHEPCFLFKSMFIDQLPEAPTLFPQLTNHFPGIWRCWQIN